MLPAKLAVIECGMSLVVATFVGVVTSLVFLGFFLRLLMRAGRAKGQRGCKASPRRE